MKEIIGYILLSAFGVIVFGMIASTLESFWKALGVVAFASILTAMLYFGVRMVAG